MPYRRSLILAALLVLPALAISASGGDAPSPVPPGTADDVAPAAGRQFRFVPVLYSHGDPSDDEQVLLELMNRARADPDAEADRVFADYGDPVVKQATDFFLRQRPSVEWTRAENRAAFRKYSKQPPLAFNDALLAAARKHSKRSAQLDRQAHTLPGELALGPRVAEAGYAEAALSESIYATARSMLFAHALFTIDSLQDVEPGETRPSTPHRLSLMNYDGSRPFTEVGIGVVTESNPATHVGPKVVTIDFGQPLVPPRSETRFVTGVCYEDRNANGAYDAGEGLAGARITSDVPLGQFTVSSGSGGYALPVPFDAGPVVVTATGESGGVSEAIGVQTVGVTIEGENVKADFRTPPDPLPAAAQTFAADLPLPLPVPDGGSAEVPIAVPAFDLDALTVGDVDVAVALSHPSSSELTLTLVSPFGTEVVLFDRGLDVADLAGTFDTTLAPVGDLSVFAGEPYEGNWRLRVTDAAGGGAGSIASWSVIVRPRWIRGVHALRTNLALTTFRATTKAAAAADTLRIAGTVDASGRDLVKSVPIGVRLLRGDGSEIQRFDVTALKSASAATVKTSFAVRQTSRATFDVTLRKQDLAAEATASPVTVEMTIGGAIVRQTVPLSKNAYASATPAPAPFFRIDSLKSAVTPSGPGPVAGDVMVTTVKGRLAGAALPLAGVVEVLIGDVHAKLTPRAFKRSGARVEAKTATRFRQMTIDTRTGAFTIVLRGEPFELLSDGRVQVLLRVGNRLGSAEVKPAVSGSTVTY